MPILLFFANIGFRDVHQFNLITFNIELPPRKPPIQMLYLPP